MRQYFNGELLNINPLATEIDCPNATDLSRLAGMTQLRILSCDAATDLTPLIGLNLSTIHCESATDLTPLSNMLSLTRVYCGSCEAHPNLDPLQDLCCRQDNYADENNTSNFNDEPHFVRLNEMEVGQWSLTAELKHLIKNNGEVSDILSVLGEIGQETSYLHPSIQDELMNHEYMVVRMDTLDLIRNYGGARPELIEKALTDDAYSVRAAGVRLGGANLTPVQLERAMLDDVSDVRHEAISLFSAVTTSERLIEMAMTDEDQINRAILLREQTVGLLTRQQLMRARMDESPSVEAAAYRVGEISDREIADGLLSQNEKTRLAVVRRGRLTPAQQEASLLDEDADVIIAAIELGGLSDHQLNRCTIGVLNSTVDSATGAGKGLLIAYQKEMVGVVVAGINHGGLSDETFQQIQAFNKKFTVPAISKAISTEEIKRDRINDVKLLAWGKYGVNVPADDINSMRAGRMGDRSFTGKILEVFPDQNLRVGLVLQSLPKGRAVLHDATLFCGDLPTKGDVIEVNYKSNKIVENEGDDDGVKDDKSGPPFVARPRMQKMRH